MSALKTLRKTRRGLYVGARILGDVIAVASGPKAVGKRLMRKFMWRGFAKATKGWPR